jgi:hypothetical protein
MKKPYLILLLCVAGCGGGSDGHKEVVAVEPPVMAAPVDAFYRAVTTVVGDATETSTEADEIASAMITEPEDSEPVAL